MSQKIIPMKMSFMCQAVACVGKRPKPRKNSEAVERYLIFICGYPQNMQLHPCLAAELLPDFSVVLINT